MNTISVVLQLLSAVILAVLTYDLIRRYQEHKGTHKHLLFWGAGLAMFGVASLCGAVLELSWSEPAFIGWFLFGVVLNAAWIGQGTVLLLFRRRWADIISIVLVLASVLVLVIFLSSPLNGAVCASGCAVFQTYKQILRPDALVLRPITPIFNIYGTITIVGGALWSSYLFYKKQILPNRVLGNVLIAAGALAVAGAGSLAAIGQGELHVVAQLIFALLIYAGFIIASRPAAVEVEPHSHPQAAATS